MESVQPSLVLGYHGCDREVAERVLAGEDELLPSRNEYDWLGSGIYFWENSPQRALDYANLLMRRVESSRSQPIRRPAVVGALIDLGHCLNLLDSEAISLVSEGYERLLQHARQTPGFSLPKNRAPKGSSELLLRYLDRAVVEAVHTWRETQRLPPFDSVRAAFIEGEPLYPDAGFAARNHIQVCVRNTRCLLGYFRPVARRRR